MADFKPGQVVKIHRPNRETNGWVGRYLQAEPGVQFAWVSFGRAGAVHAPPEEKVFTRADKCLHKLFPLSQIQPHEPVL